MKKSLLQKYSHIILGTGILAFGIYNIHSRCLLSEGGVLGLSLLLKQWFSISPGISGLILDLSMFLLGSFLLDRGFFMNSIFASSCYSLWYFLFERTGYLFPDLSSLPFLAALIGALFVGTGVGLVVSNETAAGGDDALCLILKHYFGLPVSRFYLFSDAIVLCLSLTYIPFSRIFCSVLSAFLSSRIIGFISGLKKEKEASASIPR